MAKCYQKKERNLPLNLVGSGYISALKICVCCEKNATSALHQHQLYIYILNIPLWVFLFCFEARSRLELREKSTKEDAEDVIEIMKYR